MAGLVLEYRAIAGMSWRVRLRDQRQNEIARELYDLLGVQGAAEALGISAGRLYDHLNSTPATLPGDQRGLRETGSDRRDEETRTE